MIIQVTEQIRINSDDPHNWIVERLHRQKSGKRAGSATWKALGYHGSLDQAVRSLLLRQLDQLGDRAHNVRDLAGVIDAAVDRLADVTGDALAVECDRARRRVVELEAQLERVQRELEVQREGP